MSALLTLPPELLLLIAESAAASEPPTRLGWVASLCRVCKSLHHAVTPILYGHIVFTQHNFHLLVKLALDSPVLFAYVRSVTVSGSLPTHQVHDLQSITRAMTHLRAFTGSVQALVFVLEANDDLCLSSISVTGFVDPLSFRLPRLRRCLHMATRLHIAGTIHKWIRASRDMMTEYLILDVLVDRAEDEDEDEWSLYTGHVLQRIEDIINSLPSLRRILIRTRTTGGFDMTPFHIATEKWATAKCDPRLWIDVSGATPGLDWAATELEDAAAGDELWLTGRQIYSAPLPLRKA